MKSIDQRLLVVGGGQMGRALVGGMIAAEIVQPQQVTVVDPSPACRGWWAGHLPNVAVGPELPTALESAELVLLAVKPNAIEAVARQGAGGWAGKLVVSIAAGVRLEQLARWLGHERVVRVMPNTPSLVGAGASAYSAAGAVGERDAATVEAMLGSVGFVAPVDESQLDAVTGLSGSGPAFVFVAIEALADGGVAAGLPRDLALRLAAQTVFGGAKMVIESGKHPAELKDAVASPGGTTIAGLHAVEQNKLRAALIDAVVTAARRSRDLGRQNDQARERPRGDESR